MAEGPDAKLAATGVRFSNATFQRLTAVAARLERSVSWCVRRAVEEWLDRTEKRP